MKQLALLSALLLLPGLASAESITTLIDGKWVSAEGDFKVVGGSLVIDLKFTGTASNYAAANILTGVAFDLPGVAFTTAGNMAEVGGSSTLWEPTSIGRDASAITDISKEWGLVSNAYLEGPLGPFDWAVTAASFGAYGGGTESIFAAGEIEPSSTGLNGGDFGMINAASLASDGLPTRWIVTNEVEITLTGTGIEESDLDNLANVTFFFGSSLTPGTPPPPVPEPGTIALLGLGLVALATGRRFLR